MALKLKKLLPIYLSQSHKTFYLQFCAKSKNSPLDKQSLIVFLQTFNFIYSFIVVFHNFAVAAMSLCVSNM